MGHNYQKTIEWTAIRDDILDSARVIVIKVGSAVLTSKHGLDLRVINRLADQIAVLHDQGRDIVLVSSGAVAAGKQFLDNTLHTPMTLPEKQAAAAVGQSRLMHSYEEAFERYDKVTAQILLTRDDLRSRYRYLNARNTFATLLHNRFIPIVNENDTVVVQELQFGDNDFLATLILNIVQSDLFVNLTSAGGVYDANPDIVPEANQFECITNMKDLDLEHMCEGKTTQGSGGMYSKLLAARRAAQIGVPTLIVSGKIPFVLEKVFGKQTLGTWIFPEEKAIPQRKFWMAYNLDPVGTITIDKGAQEALVFRGKSLLSAGITRVEGDFRAGDLIRVQGVDEEDIGVGLVNFDAYELDQIKGKKTQEIEQILGREITNTEAVHRDNLLLEMVF
jgi:glutamate 5-kinase